MTSGMNLTFGTHLQLRSFSNVKFENSTRFNILLVVLLIPAFVNKGAAGGCKCWNRTTSLSPDVDAEGLLEYSVAVIPGGGTYAMEAVARQFAADKKCLVIRNGWFSFRWTQILEAGHIASDIIVMMARRQDDDHHANRCAAEIPRYHF